MAVAALGAVAAAAAACAMALAMLLPPMPTPFPDRLAKIHPQDATIDNARPYDAADKWAPNGSQAGLHLLNPARVAYFDAKVRAYLGPGPHRVLDAGCGGGLVSNALAQLPGYDTIEGIDLSKEALTYARTTAAAAAGAGKGVQPRFQNGTLYTLPFAEQTFDVVVVSDVLEHLLDLPRAVREAFRVLRPGGLLLFDTIDRSVASYVVAILGAEFIIRIIERGSHDWRLFVRPSELERAVQEAGFHDFAYEGFQPSVRALAELSAFSAGLMRAERMRGGWQIEAPSSLMVSYIGLAAKPRPD